MPQHSGHAEIVGAGIGGLTTAAALARNGWSVRVHERDEEIRAYGSGIYVWDNGLAVLNELGVLDTALTGAHFGPSIETRSRHNSVLSSAPLNRPHGTRVVTILRQHLIDSLLEAGMQAGVEFVTGSTITGASRDGELTDASGETHRADLVVVADGIGSRLRDSLGMNYRRTNTGQVCARVLIDRDDSLLPRDDADKYIEFMSGKRFLLYTPSSATQAYIALVCPTGDTAAVGEYLPADEWKSSFRFVPEIIDRIRGPLRWDAFSRVDLDSWSAGRVAVLGDAAHAQPPYLGQGGGCAMTNGFALAHFASEGSGDIERSLVDWEKSERPLIEHTQRFSVGVGRLNDVPDLPREVLLRALGRSSRFARSRLRAARSRPTGSTLSYPPALTIPQNES